MKIHEIEGFDAEKKAADTLKQNAKKMQQQASAAQAKTKMKSAQAQLTQALKPAVTTPPKPIA